MNFCRSWSRVTASLRRALRTMEILGQESDYLSEDPALNRRNLSELAQGTSEAGVAEALIGRGAQPTLEAVDYFIRNRAKRIAARVAYYRQRELALSEVESRFQEFGGDQSFSGRGASGDFPAGRGPADEV